MVDTGGDDGDLTERRAANASVHDEAWKQTYEEARAMAEQRREDGSTAETVPAGHTVAVDPETDDAGRLGIVFVVPGNKVDPIEEMVADHDLSQYDVYRRTMQGRVFLVVEYVDPDEAALFVAGHYDLGNAARAASAAREDGVVHTYLQQLDGTPVASFEHEAVSKFVPDDLARTE